MSYQPTFHDFTKPVQLMGHDYPTKPFNGWDDLDNYPIKPVCVSISNHTPTFAAAQPFKMSLVATTSPFTGAIQRMAVDSQTTKLYVGNLDLSIKGDILREIFKAFGPVLHVDIHPPRAGTNATFSFAFVQYERVESVLDALSCMGSFRLLNRTLKVALPQSVRTTYADVLPDSKSLENYAHTPELQQKWARAIDNALATSIISQSEATSLLNQFASSNSEQETADAGTKIFVGGGFGESVQELQLNDIFSGFGPIATVSIIRDSAGRHRGYGFVQYKDASSAQKALSMHGADIGNRKLIVSLAKTGSSSDSRGVQGDQGGQMGPGDGEQDPNLEPLEVDFNSLQVPDPLASRYPNIIPTKQEVVVYPCVVVRNLIDLREWKAMDEGEKKRFHSDLVRDFAVFGIVSIESSMVVAPNGTAGDDYCSFYIQFASAIVAKRCVLVLNNRYFFGRPLIATYCLKLPTLTNTGVITDEACSAGVGLDGKKIEGQQQEQHSQTPFPPPPPPSTTGA